MLRSFTIPFLLTLLAPLAAAQTPRTQAFPNGLSSAGLPGGARFGSAVEVFSDIAVVGVPEANQGAGEVRVFKLVNGAWALDQVVTAPDGAPGDHFGAAIGFNQYELVVGAPDDDDLGADSGSVWVFIYVVWGGAEFYAQSGPKLTAIDGAAGDRFGAAIAAHPYGEFVIGAPGHTTTWVDDGAAYVVQCDANGDYTNYMAKIVSSTPQFQAGFGSAVEIFQDYVAVGAPGWDSGVVPESGRVEVFGRLNLGNGDFWIKRSELKPASATAGRRFGRSIAMASWRLLVGAPGETNIAQLPTGAAYTFNFVGAPNYWVADQVLQPADAVAGDAFGSGVALTATNALVAGASRVADYRYHSGFDDWNPQGELRAPFADLTNGPVETLGPAVAADDEHVIVGRPGTSGSDPGAAFPFWTEGGTWKTLGTGTLGLGGVVKLRGAGSLDSGLALELRVKYGKANAPGVLFVKAGNASNLNFHQGILYAFVPNLSLPITLSPAGELSLPAVMPPSVPSVKVIVQAFFGDPLAAGGISLSNGLEIVTP